MSGALGAPAVARRAGERVPTLLFVHAHPDDETLATGVSIAHHVRLGHDVHVLTCTLGEEGEVIPPALAHLEGADGDPLAPHRREELAAAMTVLGARSHLLAANGGDEPDGAGAAYRDSGMAGSPAAAHPRALAGADLDEVADLVRGVVREVAPDVVVSYDASGGYGHPDHVRVHDATVRALSTVPDAPTLYAACTPVSWAREDRAWLAEHVDPASGWTVPGPDDPYPPSVLDDDAVTRATIDPGVVPLQEEALRAHATQVLVSVGHYALSNGVAGRLAGREGFAQVNPATGELVSPGPDDRRERRPGLLEEVTG